jgi:dipeptidyl aminopeptidase/acylaminoacyl peptidase
MRQSFLAILAAGLLIGPLAASGPTFDLSVDSIMRGPKLVGYAPSALRWSGDSSRLYFEWRGRDDEETSTWSVDRACASTATPSAGATCTPVRLTEEQRRSAPPAAGAWDRAHRRALAVQDGDIVLLDTVAGTRTFITRTTAAESSPRFAKNETHVTFSRDNALYIVPLGASGDGLVQLTDAGPPKRDPPTSASQKFLKDEEASLLEFVRDSAARQKKTEAKREKEALPRLDLAERQSAQDLQLAHGDSVVYALVVERAQGARRADVPNYVTTSAYTEEIPARTKVGDTQDKRRLAILNLATKKTIWATLDVPPGDKPAPQTTEPKDGPRAAREVGERIPGTGLNPVPDDQPRAGGRGESASEQSAGTAAADKTPPGRELRWTMPVVSRDGKYAVATVRSADNEDRWIVLVDPETGKTRIIDALRDNAWVRESGGFGPFAPGNSGFLPDNTHYWFLSERDGWMHLYVADLAAAGAPARQLTSGAWEVSSVDLSNDERTFYLNTSEVHPGERHLYAMPTAGGARTKLTSMVGGSSGEVSPDGRTIGVLYSAGNKPPEVFLMDNAAGAVAVKVTTSPSAEWLAHGWVEPKLVTYKTRDGVDVYARLYTPEMVGAKRHGSKPAVIFVHGAGYLQNAHKYWSSYYREYMFHHLLASKGYVVLDPDYRASAGYGRDWRTAIYRHMGGKDLEDVVDGAAWLAKTERVDARRIGVYGGSYGGFITLMAMFTTPDVFAAGAALRPVTDWAHYNHGYTSNILNEPQTDAEAYRKSSPIYFAQNLKGALLICHGMVDVNVHFQDSVRLAQRLIELRKENWELAAYPVEDHGFEQDTSWSDEYKRIFKLFETNLKK